MDIMEITLGLFSQGLLDVEHKIRNRAFED